MSIQLLDKLGDNGLARFSFSSKDIVWIDEIKSKLASPVVHVGNTLFASFMDGTVKAYDFISGDEKGSGKLIFMSM